MDKPRRFEIKGENITFDGGYGSVSIDGQSLENIIKENFGRERTRINIHLTLEELPGSLTILDSINHETQEEPEEEQTRRVAYPATKSY